MNFMDEIKRLLLNSGLPEKLVEKLVIPATERTWSLILKNKTKGLNPNENYEAFEKLGDASLDFNLTKIFYEKNKNNKEFTKSNLTNVTKFLASNNYLQTVAKNILGLDKITKAKGKELSDIVEAFFGASEVVGDRILGKGAGVVVVSTMIENIYSGDIDTKEAAEHGPQNLTLEFYNKEKFAHPLIVVSADKKSAVFYFSEEIRNVHPSLPEELKSVGVNKKNTVKNIYIKILEELNKLKIENVKSEEVETEEDTELTEDDVTSLVDFMTSVLKKLGAENIEEKIENSHEEIKRVAHFMKKYRDTLIQESIGVSVLGYMIVKYLHDSRNGNITPAILNDARDFLVTGKLLALADDYLKIPKFGQTLLLSPRRVYLFFYLLDFIFTDGESTPSLGSLMCYNIIKEIIENHEENDHFDLSSVGKDSKESVGLIFSKMRLGRVNVSSEKKDNKFWSYKILLLGGSKLVTRAETFGVKLPGEIISVTANKREAENDVYKKLKNILNNLGLTEHIANLSIINRHSILDKEFGELYRKSTAKNNWDNKNGELKTLMFSNFNNGSLIILYSYYSHKRDVLQVAKVSKNLFSSQRRKVVMKKYLGYK